MIINLTKSQMRIALNDKQRVVIVLRMRMMMIP